MTANFLKDLKRGQAGEDRLHKMFPKWTRSSGRKEDFVTEAGELVECKFESRTTEQTPNVALEVESSPGKPGAIQRAVNDGVSLIVYLFADDKHFVYDSVSLLTFMKLHDNKYRKVRVPNKTYFTTVILIPRDDLKEIEVSYEL